MRNKITRTVRETYEEDSHTNFFIGLGNTLKYLLIAVACISFLYLAVR